MRPTAEQLIAELYSDLSRIDEASDDAAYTARQGISAELSAINEYEDLIDSTQDPKVKRLFKDIADEEKVHQGELSKALDIVDPEGAELIKQGEAEGEEILEESLATSLGRGIGNIGRGVKTAIGGVAGGAKNFKAGLMGISDSQIDQLIQAFEVALPEDATVDVEEPQEGQPLDINNLQDTKAYFDDLVRKILDQIDSGSAPANVKSAISNLARQEGGLNYTTWKWSSLNTLNQLGSKVFPDWKARELPQEAKSDPTDSPEQDAGAP